MIALQEHLEIPVCDLTYVWKGAMTESYHLVVRKNSKFFPGLKRQMLRLKQSGQLARLEKTYYGSPSREECNPEVMAVGMDKLGSIFIFLIVSLCVSLLALLYELLKKSRTERNETE